jgi:hypothetical protein
LELELSVPALDLLVPVPELVPSLVDMPEMVQTTA